jgi:hypothetical protein
MLQSAHNPTLPISGNVADLAYERRWVGAQYMQWG